MVQEEVKREEGKEETEEQKVRRLAEEKYRESLRKMRMWGEMGVYRIKKAPRI